MSAPSQEPVLRFLRDPGNYSHDAESFEVHQTHISWVFLAGPYAYKLKKAVSLGFLDYSTLDRRQRYAREELRLNRRLAPDVYLDVVSVRERNGRLFLDLSSSEEGREVEVLVRMKRIPPGVMLDALLAKREARNEHIDRLVGVLLPFYRASPSARAPGGHGSPEAVRRTIESNFEASEAVRDDLITDRRLHAVRSGQLSFLALRRDIFERRLAEGWVRDGHGDLRAEHVGYLPECIVMDAIEFNDNFRVIDVAADLAFLKMDLEFLGAPDLGERLIERYEAASGDTGLRDVLEFYVSYRAFVRGKVDGIKLHQEEVDPEEKEVLERRAKRYFDLSYFHTLNFHTAFLVLVGGLSGTGKSTLARGLSEELGAPVLRSDEVRKELAGLREGAGTPAPFGAGIYSTEHTQRTYERLAELAVALLEEGAAVIVDATFSRAWQRDLLREAARRSGARTIGLECRAPRETARARMERRRRDSADVSDATTAIQEEQIASYEPWPPGERTAIDTVPPPREILAEALAVLRGQVKP